MTGLLRFFPYQGDEDECSKEKGAGSEAESLMARPRGFQRSFRGARSGRLTSWIGPPDQAYVNVASAASVIISSAGFEEPVTVMRTRGRVSILPQTEAADAIIIGAVGMAIVSTEAFAAGVASIPSPFRDADWGGWFVWRTFAFRFTFADATGFIEEGAGFEVDSKAMRKVTANETLVVIAESQSGAFALFDGTRNLIKLS